MGTRGRRSAQELETQLDAGAARAAGAGGRSSDKPAVRPKPPPELNSEQAAEWRAIVNQAPPERYGREAWPILAAYCSHAVARRRVAALIAQAERRKVNFDILVYDRLLKMQERESRILASLAVRLGIGQTYGSQRARSDDADAPWKFNGNGP